MPESRRIVVDDVFDAVFTGFLARAEEHAQGHVFDLVEGLCGHGRLVVLVPSFHLAAVAERHGCLVFLRFAAVDAVNDGAVGIRRYERKFFVFAARHGNGASAGKRNLGCARGLAVRHRPNEETEAIAFALHAVGLERTALSTAVAAESRHFRVEVEMRGGGCGQLVGMRRAHQFKCAPRQRRGAHQAVGHEGSAVALGVGECAPAHIFAVAHRLGLGQHDILFTHEAVVLFYELSRFAVAVVVHRAAAVVGKVVQFLRQLHGVTDARELYARLVRGDVALELDTAVGIDGVDLIGGEFEIIGAERLRLVVHNLVDRLGIAVTVGVVVTSAVGSLTFDGEAEAQRAVFRELLRESGGFVLEIVQTELGPAIVHPVVVVGTGAEGVELGAESGFDDRLSAVVEGVESTGELVEGHFVALSAHLHEIAFHLRLCHAALLRGSDRRSGRSFAHGELFFHLHVALVGPRLLFGEQELNLHEILLRWVETIVAVVEGVVLSFARPKSEARFGEGAIHQSLHGATVSVERPANVVAGEVGEVVLVEDLDASGARVHAGHAHVLIYLLDLVVLSLRREVGAHYPVHAEHAIVGLVAEVAAVAPIACAVGRIVVDGLIHPVPNGTAHDEVIALNDVPIVN